MYKSACAKPYSKRIGEAKVIWRIGIALFTMLMLGYFLVTATSWIVSPASDPACARCESLSHAELDELGVILQDRFKVDNQSFVPTTLHAIAGTLHATLCTVPELLTMESIQYSSDISHLLPILAGYMMDEETRTFAELGSRYGYSTSALLRAALRPDVGSFPASLKRRHSRQISAYLSRTAGKQLITCDVWVSRSVLLQHMTAALCAAVKGKAEGLTVRESARRTPNGLLQGDDLKTVIPFVDYDFDAKSGAVPIGKHVRNIDVASFAKDDGTTDAAAASRQSIDTAFIDTLHNGDQLYMELLRYAPHVKRHILFHDVVYYAEKDESPSVNASLYNPAAMGARPVGLHSAIQRFLDEGGNKVWEEETFFPHNNGLYVLRRKSLAYPHPTPIMVERYASATGVRVTFSEASMEDGWGGMREVNWNVTRRNCRLVHALIESIPLLGVVDFEGADCDFFGATSSSPGSNSRYATVMSGDYPLVSVIPFLWGYTLSQAYYASSSVWRTSHAFESGEWVGRCSTGKFMCMGCRGTVRNLLKLKKYVLFDDAAWLAKKMDGSQEVTTLIASAFWLADGNADVLRWHIANDGSTHGAVAPKRVVVYGTSMVDVATSDGRTLWSHLESNGYAQRMLRTVGAGVSLWEKVDYTKLRYIHASGV